LSNQALDEDCVHITITGRVQGVWFRGWTAQQAHAIGIRGWVRNRGDGSVEAVFAGSHNNVNEMIKRCRKGPPLARVDSIDVSKIDHQDFNGFEKRPTI